MKAPGQPLKPDSQSPQFFRKNGIDASWERYNARWREPAQVASLWQDATATDSRLLGHIAIGRWWETLADCGITLLVTREYEHLVIAMNAASRRPVVTYLHLPHPSGLAVDRNRGIVHIASTRNPNQVIDLTPATGILPRLDVKVDPPQDLPLMPLRTRFLPGCLYLHDMAVIDGNLYANAVGQNAVVRLDDNGQFERVWWPRCIETNAGPVFTRNHIQLNSIAAGLSIASSFFSASADRLMSRCPGHKNFPVNRRGVIFSGETREPIAHGLTRPHSARLFGGKIWVNDSGYGNLSVAEGERCLPVVKLPGWTRGLCFCRQIAFVGTSQVLPRFQQYAPGLDAKKSICGVHAVDTETGNILGSLLWPHGNQIFALDWLPITFTSGFPFTAGRPATARQKKLFYAFDTRKET
jgi:uncharacterized protein (TIGR03032 family)